MRHTHHKPGPAMNLNTLMVRYIVNDVDAAVAFYTRHLGFHVNGQSGPHFALLQPWRRPASTSAMKSWRDPAGGRSCSRIPPAIRWNCSNPRRSQRNIDAATARQAPA
jgi:hypothetical protein